MTSRDVPFDEEVAERRSSRASFAEGLTLAELEARRRRWAAEFDAASLPALLLRARPAPPARRRAG